MSDSASPTDRTQAGIEYHLNQIQRHVRGARGEPLELTPWDYQLPTSADLAAMRRACRLTQSEAAVAMDYSQSYVAGVESGEKAPGRAFIQQALRLYRREWPQDETYQEDTQ